jgi:hypothetical protein
VGPTYQLGAERGKGGFRWGHCPAMEAETRRGTSAACGSTRPGEEGGILGRSGPARLPRLAGLISIGKKIKRVLIFRI